MPDFEFLKNPISKQWVILAPKRSKRPGEHNGVLNSHPIPLSKREGTKENVSFHTCPFCPGREKEESELFRIGAAFPDTNWQVRVVPNKYPFTPHHEIIIHSTDDMKNFDTLSKEHVKLIFQTYQQRFNTHKRDGQVFIFHNHGIAGGESLSHPHSQLVVVPFNVQMEIPRLDPFSSFGVYPVSLTEHTYQEDDSIMVASKYFYFFCPQTSQWPDEVWIVPKERGKMYSDILDEEISDLAFILQRVLQIMDVRHNNDFPFNFYIYPGSDWYLRIIPRLKSLGGFELGTGVFVNTQDPKETMQFLKTHFENPDFDLIRREHLAKYHRSV